MTIQYNDILHSKINHNIKQMRNLESHWQTGKIFYRENDKKVMVKFLNKKSNQIFLTRDLYKNHLAFYNKNYTIFNLYKSMFFWCTNLEKDLTFKNMLQDINGFNTTYQDVFMRKKRVLYFLKLKTQSQTINNKIIQNLSKIKYENMAANFLTFKNYKTLFKFFFKKLILRRIYKVQVMQFQLEKFLFVFLLKCKVYKTLNKKQFKFLFFSNKSFFIPISLLRSKKSRTLPLAQKYMAFLTKKVNFYNFKVSKQQEFKNTAYQICSKKDLNINNKLFKQYIKVLLKWKKLKYIN